MVRQMPSSTEITMVDPEFRSPLNTTLFRSMPCRGAVMVHDLLTSFTALGNEIMHTLHPNKP
ncbi:hypothetical protein BMAGN_1501 [Bifidobacterium magnum]|uniref:Uncharacterized protein n=1 Tax=Bifidobacterium magnum TaxID=1692 RepID=A0A087B9U7_9BIFI|nr:hypothetical protein BMAGN_1501 [Bifidobacterium magnum]